MYRKLRVFSSRNAQNFEKRLSTGRVIALKSGCHFCKFQCLRKINNKTNMLSLLPVFYREISFGCVFSIFKLLIFRKVEMFTLQYCEHENEAVAQSDCGERIAGRTVRDGKRVPARRNCALNTYFLFFWIFYVFQLAFKWIKFYSFHWLFAVFCGWNWWKKLAKNFLKRSQTWRFRFSCCPFSEPFSLLFFVFVGTRGKFSEIFRNRFESRCCFLLLICCFCIYGFTEIIIMLRCTPERCYGAYIPISVFRSSILHY